MLCIDIENSNQSHSQYEYWIRVGEDHVNLPVLKHGPRSLTCVRVNGRVNPLGARKLIGGILLWVAPPTDPDLL